MNAQKLTFLSSIFALVLLFVTACAPAATKAPASSSGSSYGSSSAPAAPAAGIAGSGGGSSALPAATAGPSGKSPARPSSSGILTGGEVDDHLNFPFFQRYAARALAADSSLPAFPTADRVTLHITGVELKPISNAHVRITSVNGAEVQLVTYAGTDGRLAFYPSFDFNPDATRFVVEVSLPGESEPRSVTNLDLSELNPQRTVEINLQNAASLPPSALDLMLVIDTTGSMGDELDYLTREFQGIIAGVRQRFPHIDMRFGLVVYRDQGDEYVVRSFGFTGSSQQMQDWLAQQHASGGGDEPEAVPEALQAALNAEWRPGNTARLLLHVADAPAHSDAYNAFVERIRQSRMNGIRIYPIAASGVNPAAEYLMRSSALLTQGSYLFLTDDSGVGNAHAEPKIPCYVVTRLNDLFERVVLSELSGARVEPVDEEIVRVTGSYQNGVCLDQ
jgi:hypothetical protein